MNKNNCINNEIIGMIGHGGTILNTDKLPVASVIDIKVDKYGYNIHSMKKYKEILDKIFPGALNFCSTVVIPSP